GWATMDGLGLVGRVSGVGRETSRVILLTDTSSRIPITIQPSGQRALVVGDNTLRPPIELLENREEVRPGDRVFTSGDGDVFPAGLLVGEVVQDTDRRLRIRLVADYERMRFLRVIRSRAIERIEDPGGLIAPVPAPPALAEATDG
ncbi:MAG: rod shape-determining protein MreC, partial [Shimia sp.]